MRRNLLKILSTLYIIFLWIPLHSQESTCENIGFELGDFTNWEGYTWQVETALDEPTSAPDIGIVTRRHVIISDTNVYDANTGYKLKMIPPGCKYAVRLGDSLRSGDPIIRNWEQSIRYNLLVDSGNALITIKFAFVTQLFDAHDSLSEHHFRFSILDDSGNKINTCTNFEICNSGDLFNDVHFFYPPYGKVVYWRDWETVVVDLSDFINQNITIELFAEDCILPTLDLSEQWSTCYGYAYFALSCGRPEIIQEECNSESQTTLTAPDGFKNYLWTNEKGELLATDRILEIANPQEEEEYFCELFSKIGCDSYTMRKKIYNVTLVADFSSDFNCASNLVEFTNNSYTSKGDISYFWDFGNGITSFDSIPNIVFDSSGLHPVSLEIRNSLTGCTHKTSKEVESFSRQTVGYVGNTSYCPEGNTTLTGYGGVYYNWSNCIDCDSIVINDSGNYWLVGYSSDYRCSTDTIPIHIIQEPDWEFRIEGDTVLCEGETSELIAYGSDDLLWNDNYEQSGLIVDDSGYYFCKGINDRGCVKYDTIHVMKSPPPNVEFTLSDTIINSRNYIITASAEDFPNLNYIWDMGDGYAPLAGSSVTHTYDYNYPGRTYICTLEATNEYGCKNSSYDEIVVIPFIPNVFTPNGDNLNDRFMIGADVEIFDRYGKILFHGSEGWDGKFKGQPVDPDTYFYTVTYTFNSGKVHVKKGYVTLMR